MNNKKELLMASIRCNLFMAKNIADKEIKAKYVAKLKKDAILYKRMLAEWNKDRTKTITLDLVS
jgi:hypothetical protein